MENEFNEILDQTKISHYMVCGYVTHTYGPIGSDMTLKEEDENWQSIVQDNGLLIAPPLRALAMWLSIQGVFIVSEGSNDVFLLKTCKSYD